LPKIPLKTDLWNKKQVL